MLRPNGQCIRQAAIIETRHKIGKGSEVETSRTSLRYDRYNKTVEGLVLKKFHASEEHPDWAEDHLNSVLRQWRHIKNAVTSRRREGRPVFTLPGTIRGYSLGNEQGVLMTDLTKDGRNQVYDLKEIEIGYANIYRPTWNKITNQIKRDIEIASEENIRLGGGPHPLDPWLVVFENGEPLVYLVDIGSYTSVKVSDFLLESSRKSMLDALKKVDAEII